MDFCCIINITEVLINPYVGVSLLLLTNGNDSESTQKYPKIGSWKNSHYIKPYAGYFLGKKIVTFSVEPIES